MLTPCCRQLPLCHALTPCWPWAADSRAEQFRQATEPSHGAALQVLITRVAAAALPRRGGAPGADGSALGEDGAGALQRKERKRRPKVTLELLQKPGGLPEVHNLFPSLFRQQVGAGGGGGSVVLHSTLEHVAPAAEHWRLGVAPGGGGGAPARVVLAPRVCGVGWGPHPGSTTSSPPVSASRWAGGVGMALSGVARLDGATGDVRRVEASSMRLGAGEVGPPGGCLAWARRLRTADLAWQVLAGQLRACDAAGGMHMWGCM